MAPFFSNLAAQSLTPILLRRMKWSWVGYGAAAYVGLRLMRRFGIGGNIPERAISFIDGVIIPRGLSHTGFGSVFSSGNEYGSGQSSRKGYANVH